LQTQGREFAVGRPDWGLTDALPKGVRRHDPRGLFGWRLRALGVAREILIAWESREDFAPSMRASPPGVGVGATRSRRGGGALPGDRPQPRESARPLARVETTGGDCDPVVGRAAKELSPDARRT
jgi:hypothetical protein